jgi:hypothetical protein
VKNVRKNGAAGRAPDLGETPPKRSFSVQKRATRGFIA